MKNIDFKVFINNLKVLGLAITSVFVMGSCKTYVTTVKTTYDGKQILVQNDNGEEYLIKCSKKGKKNTQLVKDIPFLWKGDKLELKAKKIGTNYEGHRIVTTDDYRVKYDENLPRIREEQLKIKEIKATHVEDSIRAAGR